MKVAIYPGSFDPFTNGHLDILKRAVGLFDHVIVGVLVNPSKSCAFSPEERVGMINDITKDIENARAVHFDGLLVEACRAMGACAIIRGLRAVSDYEFEMQMFSVNNQLAPEIETVFFMASPKYSFLSSSIAKEVARYGGKIEGLLPDEIIGKVKEKFDCPSE